MEREKVTYMIWPERRNLVRFAGGKAELYCPDDKGNDDWVEMPHLNEIRYGYGNAVWYDSIYEKEAREWMERIKKE